jgi:flagella basal body P-ring formation protein FlgA
VQVLVLLTLLLWATQTLLWQWSHAADVMPYARTTTPTGAAVQTTVTPPAVVPDSFVPPASAAGTLELRSQATVYGADVKLKQICRWARADDALFAPIADLGMVRLTDQSSGAMTIDQVRQKLRDAGVNLSAIRFAGATACTILRSDAPQSQSSDLLAQPAVPQDPMQNELRGTEGAQMVADAQAARESRRTLRDVLIKDLADRTHVPVDMLQVDFSAGDQRLLNLSEPHFQFDLVPQQFRGLGSVRWDLVILTQGRSQRASIRAMARAWQDQVVLARPVEHRQVIRHDDVAQKRVLVDRLEDQPLLTLQQVVGQQAAIALKPGTIMTARTVAAVPLVRMGQLVTVTVEQGRVSVTTVARAMEGGAYGQTIRVKNEATQDVYQVVMTGPQTARLRAPAAKPDELAVAGG